MLKKYKFVLIFMSFVAFYIFFTSGVKMEPIEKMDIPSGIGYDLKNEARKTLYSIPISSYIFTEGKSPETNMHLGIADTIAETRENRQLRANHKFILGLQKSLIVSEKMARFGIENIVDILFSNAQMNDMGIFVVCKGKSEKILNHKVKGYPSAADYIEGMVRNCSDFNFFSQNYKLVDIYVRVDSEGRNLILPYIELKKGQLKMTGMAVFKKFKMVRKVNIEESRAMNLLREDNTKGVISIIKNEQQFTDATVKVKRKASCKKVNGKYEFKIKLKLQGSIANNSLYKNIRTDSKVIKKVENDMKKTTEKMCYKFIRTMQKKYKIDCLELGRVAAAKFGRRKGTDWDKVVSNAKIKVQVDFKIKDLGRGKFIY